MYDAPPVVETPAEPVVEQTKSSEPDPNQVRVKGASDGQGTATQTETPAVTEPEVVDTSDATQKQLATLADDALVSVPVDGVDEVMTWKEAKAGFSRTSKFTKSMQQLAKEKSEFAADKAAVDTLRNERAGLEAFLNNKDAVLNYVRQTFGQEAVQTLAPVPDGTNPDEIVTYREAQAIAQRQSATLEQQIQAVVNGVQQKINDATQAIETRQETAKHAVLITSTLNDIFTANPVLKSIPNSEDLIRFEVYKMQPKTPEEAVQFFQQVSHGMAEDIGKHYKAQQKITKVAEVKAKLESKSIEPPGGTSPTIKPASYKNADGTVNWKKVTEMAKNF